MQKWTVQSIAEAAGGEVVACPPEMEVSRVCTDSRVAQAGDLFVALAGERFDGHEFVRAAAAAGATAALVERDRQGTIREAAPELPLILVENTRAALGRWAGRYRAEFDIPIIVIGGSNGKTTTKEIVATLLGARYRVLRSEASFNNEIGVPLTLLKLDPNHEIAVLEAGSNHPGELAPLVRLIRPRDGVITSLGGEHLEFFGDLIGVAQEEGYLGEGIAPEGTLFVNGDSPEVERVIRRAAGKVVRIGFGENNDWRVQEYEMNREGLGFFLRAPNPEYSGSYGVKLWGRHQALNTALGIAVGMNCGLTRAQIESGLREVRPPQMRMQVWYENGFCLLDDTYNANEDSMFAALQTLAGFPGGLRYWAVLGEMAELGDHSRRAHAQVGQSVAELRLDGLFAVGDHAAVTAQAAQEAGLRTVQAFADVEEAAAAAKAFVRAGDVVLVKASRAARLERICTALREAKHLCIQ